jgi:hypothetical protein
MLDLLHHAINLLKDSVWGGIVVAVAILIPVLGLLARTITGSRTSDLTRDEIRLLKAFNEQAKGDPRAYLSESSRRTRPRWMSTRSSCGA